MALESDDSVSDDEQTAQTEYPVKIEKLQKVLGAESWLLVSYHVTLELTQKDDQYQWINVMGDAENVEKATDYISAVCNDKNVQVLDFPLEMRSHLTNQETHSRIEQQSKTAILFNDDGMATIQGCEQIHVVLAMSAIEDIISNCNQGESTEQSGAVNAQSPAASRSGQMIDDELKRLASQDDSIVMDEDLANMTAVVKRTYLACMEDVVISSSDTEANSKQDSPVPGTKRKKRRNRRARRSKVNQNDSKVSQNDSVVDLEKLMGCAALQHEDHDDIADDEYLDRKLRQFALDKGYTEKEMLEVVTEHGTKLKHSEFIGLLFMNRNNRQPNCDKASDIDSDTAVIITGSSRGRENVDVLCIDEPMVPKHPMEEILPRNNSTSPASKHRRFHSPAKPISQSAASISSGSGADEYMEKLSTDLQEDHSDLSIAELKVKSMERQKLLVAAMTKKKSTRDGRTPSYDTSTSSTSSDVAGASPAEASPAEATSTKSTKQDNKPSSLMTGGKQRNQGQQSPHRRKHHSGGGGGGRASGKVGVQAGGQEPISSTPTIAAQNAPMGNNSLLGNYVQPLANINVPRPTNESGILSYPRPILGQRGYEPPQGYEPPTQQQHHPPATPVFQPTPPGGTLGKRYIVIDGSNVAMAHGNHKFFSCRGIEICINYFKRKGHTRITAFVPQWRTRFPAHDKPIRDQHILDMLREQGVLTFTPARRIPGQNIVCYDDKFVLRLAEETEGVVISNDNYRDLYEEKREWRIIIKNRLIMYSFVNDIFMVPDDPLGRYGPTLDQLLSVPKPRSNYQNMNRNDGWQTVGGANSRHGYGGARQKQYNPLQAPGPNQWVPHTPQMPLTHAPTPLMPTPLMPQAKEPNQPAPVRAKAKTRELFDSICVVFPDNKKIVQSVLDKNPSETDIEVLSDLVMQAL